MIIDVVLVQPLVTVEWKRSVCCVRWQCLSCEYVGIRFSPETCLRQLRGIRDSPEAVEKNRSRGIEEYFAVHVELYDCIPGTIHNMW